LTQRKQSALMEVNSNLRLSCRTGEIGGKQGRVAWGPDPPSLIRHFEEIALATQASEVEK
jgi:hypothetical protein